MKIQWHKSFFLHQYSTHLIREDLWKSCCLSVWATLLLFLQFLPTSSVYLLCLWHLKSNWKYHTHKKNLDKILTWTVLNNEIWRYFGTKRRNCGKLIFSVQCLPIHTSPLVGYSLKIFRYPHNLRYLFLKFIFALSCSVAITGQVWRLVFHS